MRIFETILLESTLAQAFSKIETIKQCNVNDLSLPINAERWDCADKENVAHGTHCYVICKENYLEYTRESRIKL